MVPNILDKDKRALALIKQHLAYYGKRPSLREINQVTGGKSSRSANLVIDRLVIGGLLKKIGKELVLVGVPSNSESVSTVDVPLVGTVTCGTPVFAEENIQTYIPVSTDLAKKGASYFFLRAIGDSMNQAGINGGDLLLIRQQNTAGNGDRVVALINDEATVKIFEQADGAVVLRPKSSNKNHKPIILTDNCMIQGLVVAVVPGDLY